MHATRLGDRCARITGHSLRFIAYRASGTRQNRGICKNRIPSLLVHNKGKPAAPNSRTNSKRHLKRIAREVVVAQARIQPTHTIHPPPTRLHVHYATTTPDKPQPSLRGAKQIMEHQSEVEHAPLDATSKGTGTDQNRGNNKKHDNIFKNRRLVIGPRSQRVTLGRRG